MTYNQRERNPNFRHGAAKTQVYQVWAAMHDRCSNPNNPRWHRYGGRGITVCPAWKDFTAFVRDVGVRPVGTTLERRDNNLGYSPDNCVWAPRRDQYRNRSTTRLLTRDGETMCISDWARRLGLTVNTFAYRLRKGQINGFDAESPR